MDPMTFSIIRHRLFRIVDEAVITLKHVSGSAITNEGHDLMVSLYRADGTLLMGGVGFLHHLTSAAEACKSIIRRFEGDIHEGDVFLLNDPYTAALHTSDIYLVAPIHYEGKLVAWSACFVHVYDIGAVNPGGFAPQAPDIYTEGFSSPGIRLVSGGEIRQDVLDTLLNMVRSPEMVTLDLRSMIACNNVANDRMRALIGKYGPGEVDAACSELIRQSEDLFRARLRELPDGEWQSRQYLDVNGETARVLLTMTKQDDRLIFDFTGSDPQSRFSINCTKWASRGGLFAPLFPLLCYDITWNEGVLRPVEMIAPEGSIVNCTRPAPVSVATVGAIQSVNNAACSTIGKMLNASEKYRTQATAVWHANHFAIFKFGRNQRGGDAIGILTETFAGAGGARSFADGVEIGGEIPNPISRMANVETVEASFPVRYLFRRRAIDSGGPGKFRGGTGGELAMVPHKSPDGGINYVISGKGARHPMSEGLAGGYPGAPNSYVWVQAPKEDSANRPVTAGSLDELDGTHEKVSWGVYPLAGRDALYVRWNGGGGYGDPIERDPDAVRQDVAAQLTSAEVADAIFGVTLTDGGAVDEAGTAKRRAALRATRLEGHEGAAPIGCPACNGRLNPDNGWKEQAVRQEVPLANLGAKAFDTGFGDVVLRHFYCPTCAALLDTETATIRDPILHDKLEGSRS